MEITDVKVKLVRGDEERLKASCTVIIDNEFIIRDVKVIEGTNGLFVAMPSRKLTDHCAHCRHKNHLRARFCNNCGGKLDDRRAMRGRNRPIQLHAEMAHPINSECRERLQTGVMDAYESALASSEVGEVHEMDHDEVGPIHEELAAEPEVHTGYDALINDLKDAARKRRESGDEYELVGADHDGEADDEAPQPTYESQEPATHRMPSTVSPPTDDDFGAGLL